jgi:hypothetical protein
MTAGVIRFPDVHDDRHRVMMHGVDNAFPSKDGKILTLSFTGKNKTYVMMYASLMPILEKYRIVMMLTPQYFHQSRTGGRICVREDGLEINLLTLLGDHYGIPNPAWSTRNCWRENPALVISQTEKPVGGTKEYMKAYYLRTTATRREAREEAKRAKALAHVESRTRVDEIDDIIASLKGSGGGGPQTSESEIRKGRTLYGRDISHNDSRE